MPRSDYIVFHDPVVLGAISRELKPLEPKLVETEWEICGTRNQVWDLILFWSFELSPQIPQLFLKDNHKTEVNKDKDKVSK